MHWVSGSVIDGSQAIINIFLLSMSSAATAADFNCCTMSPPPAVVFSPPEVKFPCADIAVGVLPVMKAHSHGNNYSYYNNVFHHMPLGEIICKQVYIYT